MAGTLRSTRTDSRHSDAEHHDAQPTDSELTDAQPRDSEATGDPSDASEAHDRLRRLEVRFAQIQQIAQLGCWEWDLASDVVSCSDEFYRLWGIVPGKGLATYGELLGRIHPDDRDIVNEAVRQAIADRGSYAVDHRVLRPDGDVWWLSARGTVSVDEHGEPQRLDGVAIDVTERKRSELALQEFIVKATHSLRTPAAAIIQVARLLLDGTLGSDDHDAAMAALMRQSTRLHYLATNLFDLTALDKKTPTVMFGLSVMLGPVRLADRVRNAAGASLTAVRAKPTASATTTTTDIDIDIGADIVVVAEPLELERLFVNLLTNARIHGGAHVRVTARRQGDDVIVEVRDDGPGIPADYQRDLFLPLAKRPQAQQGAGLGLAIVDQLMTTFGGSISYASGEPHGAVFTLRFAVAT